MIFNLYNSQKVKNFFAAHIVAFIAILYGQINSSTSIEATCHLKLKNIKNKINMIDCINVHHTLTDVMKNRPIKCGGASFEANMADMEGS